jgi:hypothetical protein
MKYLGAILILAVSLILPASGQNSFTSAGNDNNWGTAENWSLGHVPLAGEDVVIPVDEVCLLNVNSATIGNLTVDPGGQLLRNSTLSVRSITLTGNIVCSGAIGNGATYDALGFNIEGTTCSITGSGLFNAAYLRKNLSTNLTSTLTISSDVALRTTATGIYNNTSGTLFNVTISPGVTVDVPNGSVAVDGLNGASGSASGGNGTYTVQGTLTVGRSLYLTTDNLSGAGVCALTIASGGTVRCSTAVCTNSGTATHTLTVQAGGVLEFTPAGWGSIGSSNNTYTLNGTVLFSASGAQTIGAPAAYNNLVLSGSGAKSLSSVTVNGTLTLRGTATVSGTPTYGGSSTLEYNGAAAQTTSPANEFAGVANLLLNNPSGVTLGGDGTVAGTVTFSAGSFQTGAYTLTLGPNAQFSGEQDGRSLIGTVETTRDIQAGTSQNFGNLGLSLDNADATALPSVTVTRTTGDHAVTSVGVNTSIKRRYTVTNGGSLSRNVTFKWFQSEDNGKGPSGMGIWQNAAGYWQRTGASQAVTGNPRSLTKAVTSFNSSFTCTDDFNPLPIQLSSFRAVPSNGAIRLDWTTLSELNNYGFFVERREGNSPTFVELAGSFLAGHGTTNEPQSYTWTDETSSPGVWYYRLKQMDLDGSISFCDPVRVELPTGVTESQPVMFTLMQNYPNPFNPTTTIEFSLPEKNATTLRVYDVLGREVAALVDGMLQAGRYAKSLDANRLSSGMYFYVLRSGRLQSTRTMMLLK